MSGDEWQDISNFLDSVETLGRVHGIKDTAETLHLGEARVKTSFGLSRLVLVAKCESTFGRNVFAGYEILFILVARVPLHRSQEGGSSDFEHPLLPRRYGSLIFDTGIIVKVKRYELETCLNLPIDDAQSKHTEDERN